VSGAATCAALAILLGARAGSTCWQADRLAVHVSPSSAVREAQGAEFAALVRRAWVSVSQAFGYLLVLDSERPRSWCKARFQPARTSECLHGWCDDPTAPMESAEANWYETPTPRNCDAPRAARALVWLPTCGGELPGSSGWVRTQVIGDAEGWGAVQGLQFSAFQVGQLCSERSLEAKAHVVARVIVMLQGPPLAER